MITKILSYLLHHANRETKVYWFYKIKDKILSRYGKVVGYDVQFIPGKMCHSCNGSGLYHKYGWNGKIYETDSCNRCWRGWYKEPTWILLQRIQFGKYIFHKPIERKYGKTNPFINEFAVNKEVIEGYIDHTRTKFGKDALVILCLLYDWKGYWMRWYISIGRGWHCQRSWWRSPRKWPNNLAHIIRYRHRAIPFRRKGKYKPPPVSQFKTDYQPEDLPF